MHTQTLGNIQASEIWIKPRLRMNTVKELDTNDTELPNFNCNEFRKI